MGLVSCYEPRRWQAENNYGAHPLHLAAQCGNAAVVNRLLQFDVRKGHKDNAGRTPRDYAKLSGHTELAKILS